MSSTVSSAASSTAGRHSPPPFTQDTTSTAKAGRAWRERRRRGAHGALWVLPLIVVPQTKSRVLLSL